MYYEPFPSYPIDNHVSYRQIEMLNIFVGFEQTNRYVICGSLHLFLNRLCTEYTNLSANLDGEVLGYVAEEPRGFFSMWSRQVFRTHRPFRALVMDASGSPILWVRTPSQTIPFIDHTHNYI